LRIALITGADIADEGGEAGRRLAALSGIHQRGNYPTDWRLAEIARHLFLICPVIYVNMFEKEQSIIT